MRTPRRGLVGPRLPHQATYSSACSVWCVTAQTATSVRFVIPSFRKIRFRYSLIVPSVRCSSWAISLFSLACVTRLTTCFSRKLSFGLSGFFPGFGTLQVGQILFPPSRRKFPPHRKQLRRGLTGLNSIVVTIKLHSYSVFIGTSGKMFELSSRAIWVPPYIPLAIRYLTVI